MCIFTPSPVHHACNIYVILLTPTVGTGCFIAVPMCQQWASKGYERTTVLVRQTTYEDTWAVIHCVNVHSLPLISVRLPIIPLSFPPCPSMSLKSIHPSSSPLTASFPLSSLLRSYDVTVMHSSHQIFRAFARQPKAIVTAQRANSCRKLAVRLLINYVSSYDSR